MKRLSLRDSIDIFNCYEEYPNASSYFRKLDILQKVYDTRRLYGMAFEHKHFSPIYKEYLFFDHSMVENNYDTDHIYLAQIFYNDPETSTEHKIYLKLKWGDLI